MRTVEVLKDWWLLQAWYKTPKHLVILRIIFPIKSFQKQLKVFQDSSKTIYFQIRWKVCLVKWEKRIDNMKDCPPSPRYPNYMGKRDCNILSFGTWRSVVKVAAGWLPTSFLAFGTTRLAECARCKNTSKNSSKPFIVTFIRSQMIELWLFCYEASEPTPVAFVGIVQILNQKSRYFCKPSNFHHLLHFKPFIYPFNRFQLNLAIVFVPYLPFPAWNPPVHML